uniref:Methyltransferase FkbM domain-containing protein n=1 Tax=viral metagenome TaxID=1070528 RepID=A0A6C0HXG9_9ZZZZ
MRILFIGVPVVEIGLVYEETTEETDFEYVVTNTLDLPDITYRKLIFYNNDRNYHKWFTIPKEKLLLANAPAFLNYQTFDPSKPLAEVIREDIQSHLTHLSKLTFPTDHIAYLKRLKESGFEPKVIYDIGSCILHWTKEAKKLWPDATFILFDAFEYAEFLYEGYDYHIGVLSDEEKEVDFYQNEYFPGGNSYYREIGSPTPDYHFPKNNSIRKRTFMLDKVVKERGFPLPDFIKIDVQGSEMDILKGGLETVKHATRLIVELQHMEYNEGAMQASESVPMIEGMGFRCVDPMFTNAGPDGDYGFINTL